MGHFSFIIGDAGSGKSTYIYKTLTGRTLEEPDRSFYLVVPEQNTLKAQQELIRHSPVHGMLSLDVLSFTQLSYRVMEELDIPVPDVLDEISKSVLLRKALRNVKKDLTVYKNKTESQGFVNQLKSALSEFSQYGVTAEELKNARELASTPLLAGKLSDLELIFSEFNKLLHGEGKNHVIPEDVPGLLLKNMDKSRLLEGAVLYFDGFTGFTPLQLAILERMAEQADSLTFAVTIPESELHRNGGHFTDLFWLSRETVKKVTDACTRAGICQEENIVLERKNGEDKRISASLSVPASLDTLTAAFDDPTDEIRFIAGKIRERAVLAGGRYRRMAVAVSELNSYREIIRREFQAMGIPFFIDDRSAAAGSPVVELLRSALLSVKEGYSYEDVMTYLKNPLVSGTDRDMLDIAENVVRATGLKGRKAWQEDWSLRKFIPECAGEDVAGLNAWKEERMEPVFKLHDGLKEEKTCAGKAERTLRFLEDVNLSEEKLSADDARFLELSVELLERLSSLFNEETMGIAEFTELVEAGFSDMKAGMIPAGLDSVSVGDLKRSRFDDIDDLYLAGANEGRIPQTVSGGGIFTDRERMELSGKDLELAPDDRHDAVIQNFYLYLYLHKPVRSLTISYACTGRDGARQKPSEILNQAEITFPGFTPMTPSGLLSEFTTLLEEAEGAFSEELANKLRRDWILLREEEEMRAKAEAVLDAARIRYQAKDLPAKLTGLLYGEKVHGSVTSLETYERCPYRYFLQYGLALSDRETFDVEAVDVGQMYHSCLDGVIRELKEQGKDLGDVDPDALREITAKKVLETTENYYGGILRESARNRYISAQIERITQKTLEKLAQQYRQGQFATMETERSFRLNCGNMVLHGRIDRVDTLEAEGKTYVKVIDYKSGSTEFDLGLCYEGLQMQLAAYMMAELEELEAKGKNTVPAGMFLYHIKDPVRKAGEKEDSLWKMDGICIDDPEILEKMDRSLAETGTSAILPVKMTSKGLSATSDVLDEASFRQLLKRNRERMNRDALAIGKGDIRVLPVQSSKVNGCDYCGMQSICGYDRRIPGYDCRYVYTESKSVITEKLKEEKE